MYSAIHNRGRGIYRVEYEIAASDKGWRAVGKFYTFEGRVKVLLRSFDSLIGKGGWFLLGHNHAKIQFKHEEIAH